LGVMQELIKIRHKNIANLFFIINDFN